MLQRNLLQNDRARALLDSSQPSERAEGSGPDGLNFLLGVLRRRYALIILTAALVFTASVTYLRITPPTYTAQVKVLLANPKAPFIQQQSVLAEAPIDAAQLESQIQVLTSKAIATSVIKQLGLADDLATGGDEFVRASQQQAAREDQSLLLAGYWSVDHHVLFAGLGALRDLRAALA